MAAARLYSVSLALGKRAEHLACPQGQTLGALRTLELCSLDARQRCQPGNGSMLSR